MKHIAIYIRSSWWKISAITEISSDSKEEAAKAHLEWLRRISIQDLIIYTDGSDHDGYIGAAIHSPTIRINKGKYISTDNIHNIYAAELMAIQMAVKLFEEKINEYINVYIFTDNQSIIQTIESSNHQSGQYIIKKILDIIEWVQKIKPISNIHIEWMSEHEDIENNEQADQTAKMTVTPNSIILINRMRSAQKRSIQVMMKIKWKTEWRTGKEIAKRLWKLSQHPDTATGSKLYGVLQQRKHVIWLTRLRTGHCHLNEYLHWFKIIEISECECSGGKETVDHFLLNCEIYDEEWDRLRRKVGAQGMRISTLLENTEIIQEKMEYIERMGRFKLS